MVLLIYENEQFVMNWKLIIVAQNNVYFYYYGSAIHCWEIGKLWMASEFWWSLQSNGLTENSSREHQIKSMLMLCSANNRICDKQTSRN